MVNYPPNQVNRRGNTLNVQVYAGFEELPDDLSARLAYPAQPDVLSALDWFQLLYETSADPGWQPRIYVVADEAGPGLVLYCWHKSGSRELHSLTNFYTTEYQPVPDGDADRLHKAGQLLADYLAAERPRWTSINLRLVIDTLDGSHPLLAALHNNGFAVASYFQFENWYLPSAGLTFDDYYASRSSRTRNTVRRRENKAAKTHDIVTRVFTDDDDALDGAIDDYITVYNRSWKKPEPYERFIPGLVRTCARLGVLRLGVLYFDGQPVAAQLWIVTKAKALIYKLAYDEKHKALSPGSILSRELFNQVLSDDAPDEVDYGVGSDGYKKEWMTSVRTLNGWQALNKKTVTGLGRLAAEKAKRLLKKSSSG